MLPGFTQDNVKELRKEAEREGMDGISPRYVQDKISNALVSDTRRGLRQPVHGDERAGDGPAPPLAHHQRRAAQALPASCIGVVKQEYEDIVKNEVQRAISADEDAIAKLCANYIDNIKAYTQKEKVKNKLHRPGRGAGRAADAVDRGEDRHPRERARTTSGARS